MKGPFASLLFPSLFFPCGRNEKTQKGGKRSRGIWAKSQSAEDGRCKRGGWRHRGGTEERQGHYFGLGERSILLGVASASLAVPRSTDPKLITASARALLLLFLLWRNCFSSYHSPWDEGGEKGEALPSSLLGEERNRRRNKSTLRRSQRGGGRRRSTFRAEFRQ